MAFDETYDRTNDWFISNLPKSTILVILYIIKDFLTTNPLKEPTKSVLFKKSRYWGNESDLRAMYWWLYMGKNKRSNKGYVSKT